jgi:hypothetical protein
LFQQRFTTLFIFGHETLLSDTAVRALRTDFGLETLGLRLRPEIRADGQMLPAGTLPLHDREASDRQEKHVLGKLSRYSGRLFGEKHGDQSLTAELVIRGMVLVEDPAVGIIGTAQRLERLRLFLGGKARADRAILVEIVFAARDDDKAAYPKLT